MNRLPIGIGKIGAGFNHHHLSAGPLDVEIELIRLSAGIDAGRLHLRQPRRSWQPTIRRAPVCGSGQIINGCKDERKSRCPIAWGIAHKVDFRQVEAELESAASNVGDTIGNRIAACAKASRILNQRGLARIEQDSVHAAIGGIVWSHCYCLQRVYLECSGSDAGDAAADGDVGQALALPKRIASNVGDTVEHCDAGQVGKSINRSGG